MTEARHPSDMRFLEAQLEAARKLSEQSDLVELSWPDERPPTRYLARFFCKGLVRDARGEIREASRFDVHIEFHQDYLIEAQPMRVLTWLAPAHVFHPNIMPPLICVGKIPPATPLVALVYLVFELVSYREWAPNDAMPFSEDACQWALKNQHRFPTDPRPLFRRSGVFSVGPARAGERSVR